MEKKYIEPLKTCCDTLAKTDGINYVILVADAVDDDDSVDVVGGNCWNIERGGTAPDFFTMVGGIIENYLNETDLRYTDKLKVLREFNTNLIEHVTMKEEEK